MLSKEEKIELVLKCEEYISEKILKCFGAEAEVYYPVHEMMNDLGLNFESHTHQQVIRAAIHRSKTKLYQIGFLLVNRRNIGYKIGNAGEVLDECEKQIMKARSAAKNANKLSLPSEDASNFEEDHEDRLKQLRAVTNARIFLRGIPSGVHERIKSSPFNKYISSEIAPSALVQSLRDSFVETDYDS